MDGPDGEITRIIPPSRPRSELRLEVEGSREAAVIGCFETPP
ncbi:hypothetical protein [Streptomyces phaeoluteigriseus]|nr:hypothetical protein [Streptomyces phaeoluteigriseus]